MKTKRWYAGLGMMALAGVAFVAWAAASSLEEFEASRADVQARMLHIIATEPPERWEEYLAGPDLVLSETEEDAAPGVEPCLNVVGVYPMPGAGLAEELVLFFDEALAPFEDEDGAPRVPAVLSPNLEGRAYIRGNSLRFYSPFLRGLAENDAVETVLLTLHPELESVSGRRVCADQREQAFLKAQMSMTDVRAVGATEDSAIIQVSFSLPVDRDILQEFLLVQDTSGRPVEWQFADETAEAGATTVDIAVPDVVRFPLAVTVRHGMSWGAPPGYVAATMRSRFPDETLLQVREADYRLDEEPVLYLVFSKPVSGQDVARFLEIREEGGEEPIGFEVNSVSGPGITVILSESSEESPPETITAMLPAGMPSKNGASLLGTKWTNTLKLVVLPLEEEEEAPPSPESQELLSVRWHYWNDSDVDGYQLVMNLTASVSIDELRSHLTIVPPVENMQIDSGGWSGQVLIGGDWASNQNYALRLKEGLESVNRTAVLKRDVQVALQETPMNSGAEFDTPRQYYFLRKEAMPPRVKARNITEASVKLARIFPSNLPVFVRDYLRNANNYSLLDNYAGELGTLDVSFPDVPDKTLSAEVDLEALMPSDRRGVFIMSVEPVFGWHNAQRLLVYTDMGALAHWTDAELVVFVHDLFTLDAIERAQVTVYSDKFQPMGVSATGEDGLARLGEFDPFLGTPALVVIEKGEDYTFLDLREKQEHRTPFTASMPEFDRDGYDAYLYLDRNLYRPGEPVRIRWITRTRYVDALPEVPLQLRIANPQGRWIHEMPVVLSEFGSGGYEFQSERVHPTGKYAIELRVPGAAEPVGRASFNLEEFVPNRLKALAEFDRERLAPGDTAVLTVTAENLFGGVASGRKTEGRVFLRPVQYESPSWPGYHFGNEDELEQSLYPLGESVTDSEGRSTFKFTFEPEEDATMPLEVVASGRVLELGGRAVTDSTTAAAVPDGIMLGLAATPRPDREMLDIHILALNPDETPADLDSVQVTLERQNWNFYLRRLQDRNDPRWDKVFDPIKTHTVELQDGKGVLELPYPRYGEYRLRVHAPETRMFSTVAFNRWWNQLQIETASRPELIRLTTNQELYSAGDRLELRIESPYDGMAYIVAQGDRFQETLAVPVENGEGQVRLTVPHTWFPNAWLQVTVVRDSQNREVAHYPYSSFSMINVPLDDPDRRIETTFLDVPEEILPDQTFEVTLETRDQEGNPVAAEITVAAVDEGIHTILGYDNPDPYSHFQRSRKMDVRQSHYYDKVFYEQDASPIGGDMMRRLGLTSQVDENWIRPVALWSGVIHSDASGRATAAFEVPEFIGQLRLVAVAVNERAVGAGAASVFVRRPHILRTSMPRFALAGDRFTCTAVAMNLSAEAVTARVRWSASGALTGGGEKTVELEPGAEKAFPVPITAAGVPGQGMLEWTMVVLDGSGATLETLTENAPLPVRPPAAYRTETEFVALMPGETRVFENTAFVGDLALHTNIEVSTDLLLRLRPGLKYLLRFPYGCVEQTVSRAMPLYLLRNYVRLYEDMFAHDEEAARLASNAEMYLENTIQRLMGMQTIDGGIGYWPGATASYPYGSVYALHFLTLIRRDHAFRVYDDAFENLQAYVREILTNDRVTTASNYYLRAYACYVLALDGSVEAIEYIPRFDGVAIPGSARHLLAAARAMHSGRPETLLEYLDAAPVKDGLEREGSGTLHSPVRADAVKLIALLHLKAPFEQQQPLVDTLVNYLAEARRFTTQEAAFAVTALSLFIEDQEAAAGMVSVRVVDADGEREIGHGDLFSKTVEGVEPRFEVVNQGTQPAYVYVEMAGNPTSPRLTPSENGIVISRSFRHEDGSKIEEPVFRHTGQYLVELTLIPRRRVENLLVTDLLPAGFEVANPRLEADKQPELEGMTKENLITMPDFLEVRDDRIAFALDSLAPKVHVFRYLVRAVTPGTFQLPALHAEGMYTPDIQATTVPMEIKIE